MTDGTREALSHAALKASSGRWIWTVLLAVVFAYLAIAGRMPIETVKDVTLIVIGFYFGRKAE